MTRIAGSAPSLSADGQTLTYIVRSGPEYSVMVGPTTGTQTAVKRATQRLDAPALSADGGRIAYQMMPRDDWEIFVADRDGGNERQVTHEIQHDLLPRFIGADRLLAVMGEPRHRRSYVYDIRSAPDVHRVAIGSALDVDRVGSGSASGVDQVGSRVRLFHNNTVRTIAPEYQWSVSPVGKDSDWCERDETQSHRSGVHAVDLQKKIAKS